MGKFTNTVKTEWPNDKPRNVVLLEDVSYIDDDAVAWPVKAGDIVNGASIPRFLWTAVGPPYVGLYRYATVIHDVHCVLKERPHQQVHQMFDDAMRDSGVPDWKRKIMARAVKWFGPKW